MVNERYDQLYLGGDNTDAAFNIDTLVDERYNQIYFEDNDTGAAHNGENYQNGYGSFSLRVSIIYINEHIAFIQIYSIISSKLYRINPDLGLLDKANNIFKGFE